jgi:hypothetical protein
MNFTSSYLEKSRNHTINVEARTKAAEYFLDALILQYNTLLFNSEENIYGTHQL